MSTLRFLHFLGLAAWLGGALAAMMLRVAARGETPAVQAGAIRLAARLHGGVIAPGVVVTLLTGLALTMRLVSAGVPHSAALVGMQATGVVAGILVLFIAVPTAKKLARAAASDSGNLPPIAIELRKRQAIVSSVAGVLAIAALALSVW